MNAYFEVQHSTDGRSFAAIGRVAGHGTVASMSAYTFADMHPGPEATNYYRLRQADLDGSSTYSPVRVVGLAAGSSTVQLVVVPNPASSGSLRVQVQYAGPTVAPATLTVRGLLGQVIFAQAITLQPGANALVATTALVPDIYWLSLGGDATAGTRDTRLVVSN